MALTPRPSPPSAGVGKSTLVARLLQAEPGRFGFSVSSSTREPRQGEVDGVDYNFASTAEFDAIIARGEFIEWAAIGGQRYGTTVVAVKKVRIDISEVETVSDNRAVRCNGQAWRIHRVGGDWRPAVRHDGRSCEKGEKVLRQTGYEFAKSCFPHPQISAPPPGL
jgi:hypothetical protein